MTFLIRNWNRLRNRPLITDLEREIETLNQIIEVLERQLEEAGR